MRNYTFYNYKGGKTLFPKNDWLTEEYLAEHEKIFMTEYLAKDDRRKIYHRYRLRTCDPTRFTDSWNTISNALIATVIYAFVDCRSMPPLTACINADAAMKQPKGDKNNENDQRNQKHYGHAGIR